MLLLPNGAPFFSVQTRLVLLNDHTIRVLNVFKRR
jgi:hypothetical protein